MANSFPPVPTDLLLGSLTYTTSFGSEPAPSSAVPLTFTDTNTNFGGGLGGLASGSTITFTFPTPGTFGTFDQTTAEATIATLITDACQVLADLTGTPLATVQAAIKVARNWVWYDSAGNTATYADTMTYPPAA